MCPTKKIFSFVLGTIAFDRDVHYKEPLTSFISSSLGTKNIIRSIIFTCTYGFSLLINKIKICKYLDRKSSEVSNLCLNFKVLISLLIFYNLQYLDHLKVGGNVWHAMVNNVKPQWSYSPSGKRFIVTFGFSHCLSYCHFNMKQFLKPSSA